MKRWEDQYRFLTEDLETRGIFVPGVRQRLMAQRIQTPSWGYSGSGTRFGSVQHPGAAVTVHEKLADAAQVHKYTGIAPGVALHVLWDLPNGLEDCNSLTEYADSLGIGIGAINPNVFQDQEYLLRGSITNENKEVRRRAIDHIMYSIMIGDFLGSEDLSLWLGDGTNYPGEGDFRRRYDYAAEALREIYDYLPEEMRLLIEYKWAEPAWYHTDLPDWGTALTLARDCGPKAQVLVDMGHHYQGQNVEQIVALLLGMDRLGGFHLNDRKSMDDDLTAGCINPYQLYLVYCELVKADLEAAENQYVTLPVAYMIDQADVTKPRIEAMIQTVVRLQSIYAKAMCLNYELLTETQIAGDKVMAEQLVMQAFDTNVDPLLYSIREEMGLAPDPLLAFRESGYEERMAEERGVRTSAGLGA